MRTREPPGPACVFASTTRNQTTAATEREYSAITTIHLQVQPPKPSVSHGPAHPCVALIGNPNAGKTTLFNALTGLRAKTANFPGTTIEKHVGKLVLNDRAVEVLDLPGLYTLVAATNEERVARDALMGEIPGQTKPTAVVLLLDATNLERNLYLASQVLELGVPTIAVLNMSDLARSAGIKIDVAKLRAELGCPVIPIAARSGEGLNVLRTELAAVLIDPHTAAPTVAPSCDACGGCPHQARYDWAEGIGGRVTSGVRVARGPLTEKIDRFLTHPVVGVLAFFAVMFAVFAMLFWIADYPMTWIETLFTVVGEWAGSGVDWVAGKMSDGSLKNFVADDMRSLLTNGIIGGVGGMLVFLPQICILFFFLSLLEDTGYLARAAFVMDRLMRRVGLPGKAFVPLLSAHACAIPAIMSTRVIENRRDRLVTILVAPMMSCSARIPVYSMIVMLLFPGSFLGKAAVFVGAYVLGIGMAVLVAWTLKGTLLKGESKPLVLELPSYKMPSLRTALLTVLDRAMVFVKKAGTAILVISIILWAAATYPKSDAPAESEALKAKAVEIAETSKTERETLEGEIAAAEANAELLSTWRQSTRIADRLEQARELDASAVAAAKAREEITAVAHAVEAADLRKEAATINPRIYETLDAVEPQRARLAELEETYKPMEDEAERLANQHSLANSVAGRVGHFIEPAIRPLGFNWQIGVGVFTSFAAREVIVSTLAIVYGVGEDAAEDDPATLTEKMQESKRADGTPVFTTATCISLLVFYVLAMQCLPTQAVVRRETGGWKWPMFQIAYMTILAYTMALIAYQSLVYFGVK